ncbi:hypothetical protein BC937DRAFT_90674 [Endogone sp. FLAS-F59071]|nr:hypothetical protein BC937DRAFT_90674 [Endogone sp. FLAS-F59071]|eukprot:RUS22001.1 hypothetical protein BC937DRAFT_90674 [Endogone sp. FLAS-F59071]
MDSATATPITTSKEAFRIILADVPRLLRKAIELEWSLVRLFIVGTVVATAFTAAYLVFALRNSKSPLKAWESLGGPVVKAFRPSLFALLLSNANPFSSSIHIRISTITKGSCSGFLKDQRKIRNPFGSIHAGALATFAETIGGVAALSTLSKKDRAILTSLKIDFKKKARGLITASSQFTLDDQTGRREIEHEVVLRDYSLEAVAIAHLTWSVETKND